MTRDELLLAALAAGEASTAGLMRVTGLTERTCRNGLYHIMAEGYAWTPARGLFRLTEAGRTIASTLRGPPAVDRGGMETVAPPPSEDRTPSAESAALSPPSELMSGTSRSLAWALVGLVAAAVVVLGRRLPTPSPGGPVSASSTTWPYDDWRSYGPK
jgi:hypothetical protein